MNHHYVSRRNFIKTTALAMPLLASGCGHLSSNSKRKEDFVSVRNGQFQLDEKPYYYVGANMWFGCYLSDAALARQACASFVRELDQLQSLGVTNIRLLAGSETSPLVGCNPAWHYRAPA